MAISHCDDPQKYMYAVDINSSYNVTIHVIVISQSCTMQWMERKLACTYLKNFINLYTMYMVILVLLLRMHMSWLCYVRVKFLCAMDK